MSEASMGVNTTELTFGSRLKKWLKSYRHRLYRYRPRFRDKHFWYTQGMVIGLACLHSYAEVEGLFSSLGKTYFLTLALFLVPLVYASLRFGFVGSLTTAVLVMIVTIPDWVFWHEGMESLGVILMLLTINGVTLFVGHEVDQQTKAREQAEAARSKLKVYAASIISTQEEERRRIARELHDDTIQSLVLLYRRLDSAETCGEPLPPPVSHEIRKARIIAAEVVKQLREFTTMLRPPALEDLGLVTSIRRLLVDLADRTEIDTKLKVTGKEMPLPSDVTLGIFRITQEALWNTERHAKAARVKVTLSFSEGGIELEILDDGIGFTAPSPSIGFTVPHQVGLVGMQERTELLGGQIRFRAKPEEGTRINLSVPTPEG